ncbi:hypothetical protein SK355_11385 [Candidatus Fukatsuia symbiotica]|uniref:hypothetical protein n=1 Tax=Candidatus Fukatsuia TaxID=1927833 RepID=UPI001F072A45|nr:hypothetical protein [Candidatus Fukatsuia symbiotica]MEA9445784.1 hypothetical protein [Candidatus Fukatsuia symbiotica]
MDSSVFTLPNNVQVKYKFSPAKYDCKHLLIVMSGFNIPDPTIYDFQNTLAHCRSNILWITDDFNGLPAYCLCNDMRFDIELGVSKLIDSVIILLDSCHVSILGASKGGSITLYYGIKHKIKNIISVVPQFNIGSYVATGTYWEHVGKK